MTITVNKINQDKDNAQQYQKDYSFDSMMNDPRFRNVSNKTAEYTPWGWKYNELSNLQVEVSRIALLVRMNNKSSPEYLKVYHSHLYSLLLPLSVIIADLQWKKIDKLWHDVKEDLRKFEIRRKTVRNCRIDDKIIERLDTLYRITLLMLQQANLGIPISSEIDLNNAIENSIIGE